MVKLEISFENLAAAAEFMARFAPEAEPTVVLESNPKHLAPPGLQKPPGSRKPRTPKDAEPSPTLTAALAALVKDEPAPVEPSSAASSSPAPVETPQDAAPDNAAAQAAIEAVFAAKGFQGAHQLLAQFGVQRLRELDAAKYGELVEYANKMLAK